ncbi:MAG: hypothetical protein BWK78_03590 [Thiotrichaceae bacterium IS1]|nr:MAG: hypothetical protein BWK78_03590 [Thiotrichaceae bacterium IS1]
MMLSVSVINAHVQRKRWSHRKTWLQQIGMFLMLMLFPPLIMPVWAVKVVNATNALVLSPEVSVVKNGKTEGKVEIGHTLEVGEEVCVRELKPGSELIHQRDEFKGELFLVIQLDNGEKTHLKPGDPCFKVKPPERKDKSPDDKEILVDNAQKSLGKWLTDMAQATYEWAIANFKGGKPPTETEVAMPLLGEKFKPAKLVAGKDVLYLAWEGKQSSFWVHVYQDGSLLQKEGFVVDKPEIVFPNPAKGFPSLSLSEGHTYQVRVIGEDRSVAEGVFTVVATLNSILPCEEMKKVEVLSSENSLAKEDKNALITTLLVENGLWLEAYQRVAQPQPGIASSIRFFLTKKEVREKCQGSIPCFSR